MTAKGERGQGEAQVFVPSGIDPSQVEVEVIGNDEADQLDEGATLVSRAIDVEVVGRSVSIKEPVRVWFKVEAKAIPPPSKPPSKPDGGCSTVSRFFPFHSFPLSHFFDFLSPQNDLQCFSNDCCCFEMSRRRPSQHAWRS